jgi:colanic acid biosynthesis glycosyl transferase WcaI
LKINLISITYPPEIGGAAHLIHNLAQSFAQMGHQVTVITCYPSYNLKEIPYQFRRGILRKDTEENITIKRVRIPKFSRTNKIARGVEHFIFGMFLSVLTIFSPKTDGNIVFSPPLPLPWLIIGVGKLRRVKTIVNIQDLFPLEAVELGMLTNRYLIRLFEGMERQVYRHASEVTVHSPGNQRHVISRGANEKHVHVVYNWVDTNFIHPQSKQNEFSRNHKLGDQFIVSYAGTMGWAQDMGTIINCANELRHQTNILFVLVGDGVEKDKAIKVGEELGLTNIYWLPMQPLSVYPEILASSDLSLINLHPELHTPVVPSKLLSIMAAGRAVVASLPDESDARQIINEAQCGICVDAGDGHALAEAIRKLESDRDLSNKMGKSGRAYIESHFSRQVCTKQMEAIIMNSIGANI